MKTNADNIKLFEEARLLREKTRASLHERATNTFEIQNVATKDEQSKIHHTCKATPNRKQHSHD